jgi:hypothetical protein
VELWTEGENIQMRQACDLRLEGQSRVDFLLRNFELARFILPNIRHAYLASAITMDVVFSRIYHGCVALDLLPSPFERISCLLRDIDVWRHTQQYK